ncbi:uncharacterized protein DNG_04386 [Cephalotrichum gorgonifer]|uniref:CorA domain-containing protein n=1 Tax=Cephalotrichum gorgonifer TaxID=2041049 RepID=A0AAE8MWZ2_9PEZI|nr:uncharacterized protein DNG_04386 [Cephalotrichum gorgonifer]
MTRQWSSTPPATISPSPAMGVVRIMDIVEDEGAAIPSAVENITRYRGDDERQKIVDALHEFRRRYEVTGANGPIFQPAFGSLFENEEREGILSSPSLSEPDPKFPVVLAMSMAQPWSNLKLKKWSHGPKTLLGYHYRFNAQASRGWSEENNLIRSDQAPYINFAWGLAVDKKNLITLSSLSASSLWASMGGRDREEPGSWQSPSFNRAQRNFTINTDGNGSAMKNLALQKKWKDVSVVERIPIYLGLFGGVIGFFLSGIIPGGWMISKALERVSGGDLNFVARMVVLNNFKRGLGFWKIRQKPGWVDSFILGLIRCTPGTEMGRLDLQLCSLAEHIEHWIEIEREVYSQDHPRDDILRTLQELWTISVRFYANFYISTEGVLYRLHPIGPLERLYNLAKSYRLSDEENEAQRQTWLLGSRIAFGSQKQGETLQDLEYALQRTTARLSRDFEAVRPQLQRFRDKQSRGLLQAVDTGRGYASLACLLKMCTLMTPTRSETASRMIITETYARMMSQLEWLIRDRVSQTLVSRVSHLTDELRILKDVVTSQRRVISALSRMIARHMSVSGLLTNVDVPPDEPQEATSNPNRPPPTKATRDGTISEAQEARVSEALQRESIIKHEAFLNQIRILEDTATRILRQASGRVWRCEARIKSEGQSIAIFVFTVVTVLFLPLSFVTSYMGMNASDIRDMDQGQWLFWAVGGPVSVCVFLGAWLIAFKGPGWRQDSRMRKLNEGQGWRY